MTHIRETLVVLALFAMAGCGEGPPPPPPPTVVAPVAPVSPSGPSAPTNSSPGPVRTPAQDTGRSKSKVDPSTPDDKVFLVDAEVNNFDVAEPVVDEGSQVVVSDPVSPTAFVYLGTSAPGAISQKLPEGFTALGDRGATPEGWPLRIRCSADNAEMVYIPSGVFRQGIDNGPADAVPSHPVYLDAYYIDVREITLEQFYKAKAALKESGKATLSEPANSSGPHDHPALGILWRDAVSYCKWSKKELPTEAEWEMAARGTKSFIYPWGNDRVIWERARRPGQIDPVGSFRSDVSPFGLEDVAGNAREWCSDFYSAEYYSTAKERDGSPIRNPQGPRSGPVLSRVAKGGKGRWELWARAGESMQKSVPDIGFRCVVRLSPSPESAQSVE